MTKRIFLFFIYFGVLMSYCADAQTVEIDISQIKELSGQYSPQWQQFENRLDYSVRGEQAGATRINPTIAYDLEFLDNGTQSEYEQYLYLQKEFRLPGHYRNLRERRDSRISQLEYETESSRAEWMATTRLGFIQIILNKQEIENLGALKNQIDRLSEASQQRAEEGETAALDNQLLQMSRYHLESRIDEKRLENDRFITLWKSRMGFDEETDVRFIGSFNDGRVNLPQTAELIIYS